jgi:hypothetical protein
MESIRQGNYLSTLLDYTFAILGHSRGKPVDARNMEITSYTFDDAGMGPKETQNLLVHIYFLCLKYISSLTKAWWIECKARLTVVTVESWTEKFVCQYPQSTYPMSNTSRYHLTSFQTHSQALRNGLPPRLPILMNHSVLRSIVRQRR